MKNLQYMLLFLLMTNKILIYGQLENPTLGDTLLLGNVRNCIPADFCEYVVGTIYLYGFADAIKVSMDFENSYLENCWNDTLEVYIDDSLFFRKPLSSVVDGFQKIIYHRKDPKQLLSKLIIRNLRLHDTIEGLFTYVSYYDLIYRETLIGNSSDSAKHYFLPALNRMVEWVEKCKDSLSKYDNYAINGFLWQHSYYGCHLYLEYDEKEDSLFNDSISVSINHYVVYKGRKKDLEATKGLSRHVFYSEGDLYL